MPWLVLLLGLLVCSMGVVGVSLAILQPTLLGGWCTLCLVSVALSVNLVGPALDEVLAALQHLRRERDEGRSLWRALCGLDPLRKGVARA